VICDKVIEIIRRVQFVAPQCNIIKKCKPNLLLQYPQLNEAATAKRSIKLFYGWK